MGAWGAGMQSSDTALDAIGSAGLSDGEPRKRSKTLKGLRNGTIKVQDLLNARIFREVGWIKDEPQALLGLAECLFDEGVDIKPIMPLVRKALRNQLSKHELVRWVDEEERKGALLRFKARISGKEVSKEDLERDNEGLLSKIAKMMERRRELCR